MLSSTSIGRGFSQRSLISTASPFLGLATHHKTFSSTSSSLVQKRANAPPLNESSSNPQRPLGPHAQSPSQSPSSSPKPTGFFSMLARSLSPKAQIQDPTRYATYKRARTIVISLPLLVVTTYVLWGRLQEARERKRKVREAERQRILKEREEKKREMGELR